MHGLFSSCGEQGLLFVAVRGLLIVVASLVVEHGMWDLPGPELESRTRARTRVPCIGRQILSQCATREAPNIYC